MTKMFSKFLMTINLLLLSGYAHAGQPFDKQIGFQAPASPVAERVEEFHNMLLVIITLISLFVFGLLIYAILKFNAKTNPEPKLFSHNTMIEIIWTAIPVIILAIISVKSIPLLYYQDRVAEPDMTLKVIGYQWYWGYEYPDHGDIAFNSYMIADEDIKPEEGQVRLLSTDNQVVLPIDTNIQILITAGDVLHSFAVPAFGIKTDAIPGHLNETWVRINEPGVYYGQCSELCGKDHSYMPIEIKAVTKEEFEEWVQQAKEEFAMAPVQNRNIELAKLEAVQ